MFSGHAGTSGSASQSLLVVAAMVVGVAALVVVVAVVVARRRRASATVSTTAVRPIHALHKHGVAAAPLAGSSGATAGARAAAKMDGPRLPVAASVAARHAW